MSACVSSWKLGRLSNDDFRGAVSMDVLREKRIRGVKSAARVGGSPGRRNYGVG